MAEHPNVWVTTVEPVEGSGPLSGMTLAVKDNIDVADVPTTAGCPAYAYTPRVSAPVVQRLVDAGAAVIGKTNLDQFATGLTGTRTPHGPCRSALDEERISGGSSSGSAVAVAAGMATFSLGTDTAGSGRVPAACNGIVGLKPTPGLLPIDGIVPACRSIDCPSVFTRTVEESRRLLRILGPNAASSRVSARARVGVPTDAGLAALPHDAREAFEATTEASGFDLVPIDLAPFFAVGDLLYGGTYVAERYVAVGEFIEQHPDDVHPVVASIILGARSLAATDAFRDGYRLADLTVEIRASMAGVDALLLPTVPHVPTVDEVLADPIGTNTALGRYTTFVNLLGFCAVSVPGSARRDGVPGGVSIIARGGDDHLALDLAARVEGEPVPISTPISDGRIPLAVVGAHLEGQPLHHQLTDRHARLVARTTTSPTYRLYALETTPPKPGLVRSDRGVAIELEVWSLDPADFASFVADVPGPLAIGKVELADGTWVPGFVCEPRALDEALDITSFGGWRAFRAV